MCVASHSICDMYDIANMHSGNSTPVSCCIRRDNDCDHVFRYNVTYVHCIGKAIRGG